MGYFEKDGDTYYEPDRCGVCGRRKGPARLFWRDEDTGEMRDSWGGWQQVGERHYCAGCTAKLLGRAS